MLYRIQGNIDFEVDTDSPEDAEREAYETIGEAIRKGGFVLDIKKVTKQEHEALEQDRINNQISY